MAEPDYPDRAEWPRYWSAIRRGLLIVLVAGAVGLVTGLLETAVRDHEWRVALVAIIAVVAFAVAGLLIDWLAGGWERRLHRS
jgi:uncharacterized integral membrane protein